MRIYEVHAYSDGFIRWPINIGYFEDRELAEEYARQRREETMGGTHEVMEIHCLDRIVRRRMREEKRSALRNQATT